MDSLGRVERRFPFWTRRHLLQRLGGGLAALPLVAPAPGSLPFPPEIVRPAPPARVGTQKGADPFTFDADRAWADLLAQVQAGPRVPNTAGHDTIREYLLRELRDATDEVATQDFDVDVRGTALHLSNVYGVLRAEQPTKVLLAAHWDSRPWADEDPNPANRLTPIPGANDGASGVAVLLEVARVLRRVPPPVGVIIMFFDGEDYGPGFDAMFLGSRYYAQHVVPERPAWGVLLDMVGDADLKIPQEGVSHYRAPGVVERVWRAARELGRTEFLDDVGEGVVDDHLYVLDAGIPMADVIDFDYGPDNSWWHTLEDTPDKCSAASLEAVGQVILRTILNAT
ncbi:MAG TPA: M28 family peptidase [Chloroflexota bacterium]|jgi:hypothetical protein